MSTTTRRAVVRGLSAASAAAGFTMPAIRLPVAAEGDARFKLALRNGEV